MQSAFSRKQFLIPQRTLPDFTLLPASSYVLFTFLRAYSILVGIHLLMEAFYEKRHDPVARSFPARFRWL